MIKKLYPNGKSKAVILSYDDGVRDDIKLVNILNKYNFKGTFNLNSGLLINEFEWTTDDGYLVKRLSKAECKNIYKNHEIASHSLTHPYLRDWNKQRLFAEISIDKENLSCYFNTHIYGFAVPFEFHDASVIECVKSSNFEYMRTSKPNHSFNIFDDQFEISPTVFHLEKEFKSLTSEFLKTDQELACYFIVGHSYELAKDNKFGEFEEMIKTFALDEHIISLTTHEYVAYILAMKKCLIDDNKIINNSNVELFFSYNNKIISVKPNTAYNLL